MKIWVKNENQEDWCGVGNIFYGVGFLVMGIEFGYWGGGWRQGSISFG